MSEKTKPETPYARLLREFTHYLSSVRFPTQRQCWVYPKAKLSDTWRLDDLAQRVATADLLGYDTVLSSTDAGLVVTFRARPDKARLPWSMQ